MKKQVFTAIALVCASLPVLADVETVTDPVSGLTFQVTTSGTSVTSVVFSGGTIPADGVVDIPSSITYNGQTVDVTGISSDLNTLNPSYKTTVTSLVVPSTVTSIGSGLFAGYSVLKDVDIQGDAAIGSGAFSGCTELSSVTLSPDMTSVPDSCFMNCTALTEITLPSSLQTIGTSAFSGAGLTEVTIPGNVSDVGDYAFQNCPLISLVILGDSSSPVPTDLGNYAFSTATLEKVICYRPVPPVLYGTGTTFKMSTYQDAYLQLLGDAQAHISDYEADKYWGWFGQNKPIYTGISVTESDATMQCEVYDLSGRVVMKTQSQSLSGLPRGIYVVNGRKVAI